MFRRATYLAVLWAFAACTGGSTNSVPQHSARHGQQIEITDSLLACGGADTVRFGRMHEGEIAVKRIWLVNRTATPVVPLDYDRTCGCTTLDFDRRPIRPDSAARVEIRFDSRGEWGWQMKRVDVKLSGQRQPFRLYVEADIE